MDDVTREILEIAALVALFLLILVCATAVVAALLRAPPAGYAWRIGRGQGHHRRKRGPAGKRGVRTKDLHVNPRSNSEQLAISYLEEVTGKSFPTVNPPWLVWRGRTLELDGYNEELGIALEFSGPLHTKWTPTFEPYAKYFARLTKDRVKLKLCKEHGVGLIVVDMSLPSHHWRNYILSRLFDYGAIDTRPPFYILEQRAVPFRNPQLEAELCKNQGYDPLTVLDV